MKTPQLPAWLARMFASPTTTTLAQFLADAERNGPEAQNNLGIICMSSTHRDSNDETAVASFKGAADRDYAPAQYNLALLYERGHGLKRDIKEARQWFVRAAEQGHAAAQFRLGLQSHRKSLDRSHTNAPDYRIEALKWFLLAAEHGYHNAEMLCGSLILEMKYPEITESSRRARAFRHDHPNPPSAHSLPNTA
jgi:TPR repeat protein